MLSKDEAIGLLLRTFDDNKLSFREIRLLKSVFDQAVEACNQTRLENLAEYEMGRAALPDLYDQDTEDDFFLAMECEAEESLSKHGIKASKKALEAITEFAVEKAGYEPRDFYYAP